MDNNSYEYNKIIEPKTVDAVNINGKYIDSSAIKSKIAFISKASAIIIAFLAILLVFFI